MFVKKDLRSWLNSRRLGPRGNDFQGDRLWKALGDWKKVSSNADILLILCDVTMDIHQDLVSEELSTLRTMQGFLECACAETETQVCRGCEEHLNRKVSRGRGGPTTGAYSRQ